jgi:branched-chain amino acid transport system permease protein
MVHVISLILAGIAEGVPFFLAAAGMSLVLGVMEVLNFAQGGLFMLGAFVLRSLLGGNAPSFPSFLLAILVCMAGAALLGAFTERTLFVRTYSAGRHALIGVLVSFGLLITITGAVPYIWATASLAQQAPAALGGHYSLFGAVISKYSVFLIVCGALVVVAMYLLLKRSRFGKTIVAVATDRSMAAALGVRTWLVSMSVFAIAGALAGLGGALIAPIGSIDASIGESYLLYAFVAMVIGGLGSLTGTFIGAMLIGIADSLAVNYAPVIQPYDIYIVAAVVLLVRPRGIFAGVAQREA